MVDECGILGEGERVEGSDKGERRDRESKSERGS